jgi:long-subunit acyl-CoA synthetase (AMP-forming)
MVDRVIEAVKEAKMAKCRILQFSDKPNPTSNGIPDWRSILPSAADVTEYCWPEFNGPTSQEMIATLNFSSGTTGLPKGVAISHHNLIANVEQASFITRIGRSAASDDRWIGFLPMYHAYGQLYFCLMCVQLKTPVYVMTKFVYDDFLRSIRDYRITTLHLAPRK